jgi:putative Mg2+ transporter-C (MgtC) family protein
MFVGIERKNRAKEAGTRTHFVVACGAALIMVISKYAFFDLITDPVFLGADVRLDPSRVASTIASGIGFLGAGMIFVHKNTVIGLTTAAGIWATSGIGMAIGAGMYVIGISVTFIILIAQILLHMNIFHRQNVKVKKLFVANVCENGYQKYMMEEFEKRDIHVQDVSVDFQGENSSRDYTFTIDMPLSIVEDEIIEFAKYDGSIKSL